MGGQVNNRLFSDKDVEKVDGSTASEYFKTLIATVKGDLISILQEADTDRKKQMINLVNDLQKKTLSYEGSYPSLELLLNMCDKDFDHTMPELSKKQWWEWLFAYYEWSTRGETGQVSTKDTMYSRSEMKKFLEILRTQFSDPRHTAILNVIQCILSFQNNGEEEENMEDVLNIQAPLRELMIKNKIIDIPSALEYMIISGTFEKLSWAEKDAIINAYSGPLSRSIHTIFETLLEKQSESLKWLEDKKDTNDITFLERNEEIKNLTLFTNLYSLYRLQQLQIELKD